MHSFGSPLLKKLSDGLIWLDKHLSRKKIVASIVILAVVVLAILGIKIYDANTMTPFEYVEKNAPLEFRPAYGSVMTPYTVEDENTGYAFVFYNTDAFAINCMVLKNTFFGYETVRNCGKITCNGYKDSEQADCMYAWFRIDNDNGLCWGYVSDRDGNGVDVYLGDEMCNVSPTYNDSFPIRIFWRIDNDPDLVNREIHIVNK